MSRNFELLQQIGKEQDVFTSPGPEREAPVFEEVVTVATPEPVPVPQDTVGIEEVRTLVQRVFLLTSDRVPRTVVFTGTEAGNGCSWISARAAESLACQVSGSVCLVDANLRSPGLHEQFGVPNHHGLSDALLRNEAMGIFVTPLTPRNLSLVSCGSVVEGVQGMVSSNRMRSRLKELRSMFDYVLVDSGAMSASNDALALGAALDGVILVLKANSSRKETARNAVRDFQAAQIRVLGAVLNQRTFPIPDSIYKKL